MVGALAAAGKRSPLAGVYTREFVRIRVRAMPPPRDRTPEREPSGVLGASMPQASDQTFPTATGRIGWTYPLLALLATGALLVGVEAAPLLALRGTFWALAVAESYFGWGYLLNLLVAPRVRAPWSLRACWGIALLLAIGGPLLLASVANGAVLVGLVYVGIGLLLLGVYRERPGIVCSAAQLPRSFLRNAPLLLALGFCLVFLGVLFVGSVVHPATWYFADDGPAYLAFVRGVLVNGTIDQPFSIRSLQAYGGQTFLQAMVVAKSSVQHLNVFDRGICTLLVAVLLLSGLTFQRIRPKLFVSLPVLVLVTLPDWRANSASAMSGVLLFFAMYSTLAWLHRVPEISPLARNILMGSLGAGLGALRIQYIAPVVAMLIYTNASDTLPLVGSPWKQALRKPASALSGVIAVTVGALAPWVLLSYRTFRTPMFPLFKGNYHLAWRDLGGSNNALSTARSLWDGTLNVQPLEALPFFVVGALLLRIRENRRALRAQLFALAVGAIFFAIGSSNVTPNHGVHGLIPLLVASTLVVIAVGLPQTTWSPPLPSDRGAAYWSVVALVFGSLLHVHHTQESTQKLGTQLLMDIETNLYRSEAAPKYAADRRLTRRYRAAQAHVPSAAKLAVMVDEPHRLDFDRNRIVILDIPGAVSPSPGLPMFSNNPTGVIGYFRKQSIRYLLMVAPACSMELYREDSWAAHWHGESTELRGLSRLMFDAFGWMKDLRVNHKVIYDRGGLILIDLGSKSVKPLHNSRPTPTRCATDK